MSLIVIIERPEGSTFEQEIPLLGTVEESIKVFKRHLGQDYWIVDWRLE